jgi:hypothetical protein
VQQFVQQLSEFVRISANVRGPIGARPEYEMASGGL